jgi:hypothetical protein
VPLARRAWAKDPVTAAPPPTPPAPTPTPPAASPLADALGEVVRVRFGDRLSDMDQGEVKKLLAEGLQSADRLAQRKLTNADEPAPFFVAGTGGRR